MKYENSYVKGTMYSAVLCDVLDSMGLKNQALSNIICGLTDESVIFGPAFTSIGTQVYSMPENPLIAQCSVVDQLAENEIYVLTIRGEMNCAVFGELFATAVKARGGAGVLLDGYIRDYKMLKEMNYPIFYRGKNPKTSKGRCEINECQTEIEIDGVLIRPGDYIFGDADGIVIIPKDIIEEVLDNAYEIIEKENQSRKKLEDGLSMVEVYSKVGAI